MSKKSNKNPKIVEPLVHTAELIETTEVITPELKIEEITESISEEIKKIDINTDSLIKIVKIRTDKFPEITEFSETKVNDKKIKGFADLEYDVAYQIREVDERTSKNGKPYFVSTACGTEGEEFNLFINKTLCNRFKNCKEDKNLFIIKKMKLIENKKTYVIITKEY